MTWDWTSFFVGFTLNAIIATVFAYLEWRREKEDKQPKPKVKNMQTFFKLNIDDFKKLATALQTVEPGPYKDSLKPVNEFFEGLMYAIELCGEVQVVGTPLDPTDDGSQ